MKALYLSTIAFVSYKSMVMALPTELERNRIVPLPDHAAEAGPVLENRDIHPSCVRLPRVANLFQLYLYKDYSIGDQLSCVPYWIWSYAF